MVNYLKYKSGFWANTFQLILGTVVAQLIPILLQPLLRRMFTPEEFGIMAIYFSIVSVLCVVVTLNYQTAVVLPEKDEDAMSIVLGSLSISAILSIVILIIFLLLSSDIIQFFNLPNDFRVWIWFLPLSIFLNASHMIFSNWLIRKKEFKKLSINKVSRRVAEGSAQISIGWKWGNYGLNGGVIIGDLVNGLTYLYQYIRTGGMFNIKIWQGIKSNLLRYKDFPLVGLSPNLLSTISSFIPVFLVTSLYTTELTGQFDLSRQILALPLALISASISQVLLQEFAGLSKEKKSIRKRYKKTFQVLLILSLTMCLFIFFFGKTIFLFIFGVDWLIGSEITKVLVWGYGIKLVISPLSILFVVFEKLKINALWQLGYFLVIASLYLFVNIDFHTFVAVLVITDLCMYSIYGVLTYRIVINYERKIND